MATNVRQIEDQQTIVRGLQRQLAEEEARLRALELACDHVTIEGEDLLEYFDGTSICRLCGRSP